MELLTPPKVALTPLAAYLWAPFDKLSSVCSFVCGDMAFGYAIVDGARKMSKPDARMIASEPNCSYSASRSTGTPSLKYYLH
jgi:hypothetical protein